MCYTAGLCQKWDNECKKAAKHCDTHWLRKFIGPVHDSWAKLSSEIDWDGLESWESFEGRLVMPQKGADVPAFVVELLRVTKAFHYGSYELLVVLDAVLRNDNGYRGVKFSEILDAVYTQEILNEAQFARFKLLFEDQRPILMPLFEDSEIDWDRCDLVTRARFRRPWHDFFSNYLDVTKSNVKWSPPVSRVRARDDEGEKTDTEEESALKKAKVE